MLVHRRQHMPPYHQTGSNNYFDPLPFTNSTSSPSDYTNATTNANINNASPSSSRPYLDTSFSSSGVELPPTTSTADQLMPAFGYTAAPNPAIRIQQSTPTPQQHQQPFGTSSAESLSTAAYQHQPIGQSWSPHVYRSRASHRRAPSASSATSSSPYNHARIGDIKPDQSPRTSYLSADGASRGFSNNLPTPTATPTSENFAANPLSNPNTDINGAMVAHYAMKDMLMAGQDIAPDTPDFSHSGRHSVSSGYDYEAPTTPHTMSGDEHDFKNPQDILKPDIPVPKLDRTVSDVYQDELYNPMGPLSMPSSHPAPSSNPSLLSPYRTNIHKALQAADQQRRVDSQTTQSPRSPNMVISRDPSPFRHGSPYASLQNAFGGRYNNAAQIREQQKAEAEQAALESRMAQQGSAVEPPKSISPKDTVKEYHESEEDAGLPLFPDQAALNDYETRYGGGNLPLQTSATASGYSHSSGQNYPSLANNAASWAMPQQASPSTYSATPISNHAQSSYNHFTSAPSIQVPSGMNGMSFSGQNYRQVSNLPTHEDTPDFPAHLNSMESSVSEVTAPLSSQNSTSHHHDSSLQKPAGASADTGTYTCTYHGCTLRFATPQKLQKHKREAHRSVGSTSSTSGLGSGMTSAQLMARNSQAGPHRCDRINPTTGKPCSTVFSRPYDLTRHEDTIHNSRKQKVRCALCVEEKTFSRNDALTRHMRVVHPEVDFPGKHRRRGATGE